MKPLRIAIIGYGKIAEDQHVPSIAETGRFELVATVSRSGNGTPGVPCFKSHQELLAAGLDLDAVAITTPPNVRYDIARECIAAGLDCLLEKPPTVTMGEIEDLACLAEAAGVTLFTTWHAQHNPAVDEAAKALAGKRIRSMHIFWHEDVRKWHPGQAWIWQPGGFGVFDPGINAFSIATKIFPGSLFVQESELSFPSNCDTPIAAKIAFKSPQADGSLTCSLDWRYEDGEAWRIDVETENGSKIALSEGGGKLHIDGEERAGHGPGEYRDIYAQFVDLIDARQSKVDLSPLRLVSDAFLLGRRIQVEAFED